MNIHVRRIPIEEVPKEKEEISKWLYKMFEEKEAKLEHFRKHRKFPGPQWRDDIPASVWKYYVFATTALCLFTVGLYHTTLSLLFSHETVVWIYSSVSSVIAFLLLVTFYFIFKQGQKKKTVEKKKDS